MKKILMLALLGVSAVASANSGVYVQADAGYARIKVDNAGNDNTVSYGVAVGNAMENGARFAVDYKHLAGDEFTIKDTGFKAKVQSVGVSAIYDFKNDTALTPYVGVRVSANRSSFEDRSGSYGHRTDTGVGAVAGVQYELTPNLALDGAVEYNKLGKVNLHGVKVTQLGAKAGVRYNF